MKSSTALKGPSKLVMDVLETSTIPMTAYEILGALASRGVSGPPTVYRALDKLMNEGRVHRIKSLNAFIGCHGDHTHHASSFAVCRTCRSVQEIDDARFETLIDEVATQRGFTVEQEMIELLGLCAECTRHQEASV